MNPRLAGTLAVVAMFWIAGVSGSFANQTLLADVVENGEGKRVRALIEKGAEVDAQQSDGMTALHWAAYRDDLAIARRLVKAGADVTLGNKYGVTPLSLACENGNMELVTLLLDHGADANRKLSGGELPLMIAARTGDAGCVKILLARGADVNARERKGQTALMWAAAEGNVEVVDLLLEAGADFKTPLKSGFTPLLFAVREGETEVVQRLLKAGVPVNDAAKPENPQKKGLQTGATPLSIAVENAHFQLAIALVKAGADPNDQRSGWTPLHALTAVRKTGIGDNEAGNPPPPGSGRMGSLQFVRELVKLGADVDARIDKGKTGKRATPFFLASKSADLPYLQLLVELGADPTIPNVDNSTPIMVAAGLGTHAPEEEAGTEEEALETVGFLLELGAEINGVDKNGETTMHGAAYGSLPKMVRFLDKRGARIEVWNKKNKRGWTPLIIAQGFRPGNFKPADTTIAAISEVMRSHNMEPPPPPPRTRKGWEE